MRTGARQAGHRGYYHETAFYGSDEEFLSIVVPFLEEALDAGWDSGWPTRCATR